MAFFRFLLKHERRLILILVAASLAAGVLYSARLGGDLRYPDERDYLTLARNMLSLHMMSRNGVDPTAFRPPGYPVLLCWVLLPGGGVVAARILNFTAMAMCLWLLFLLCRSQASAPAGLLAVVFALGYPVLFYTAGTLYPQTVAACLFLGILCLCFLAPELRAPHAAAAGALFGVLILTVPTFVFTLAFVCVWLVCTRGKHGAKAAAVVLAVTLAVMSPWLLRNHMLFDRFVFVSTNGGRNLLIGNSANTTPNSGVNVNIAPYEPVVPLDEAERSRHYARRAMEFVRAHPFHAARLYALKFLNYFNFRNRLYVRQESSGLRDAVMLLTYGGLLCLAVLRVVFHRRFPLSQYERFALALYVLNGAFAAVFFTRIRFRLPFDWLLVSVGAVWLQAHRCSGFTPARPRRSRMTRSRNSGLPTT
ncbi:hypothetical protein ACFLSJ_08255 [Verrucomicrobiota bacterium]